MAPQYYKNVTNVSLKQVISIYFVRILTQKYQAKLTGRFVTLNLFRTSVTEVIFLSNNQTDHDGSSLLGRTFLANRGAAEGFGSLRNFFKI